MMQRIESWLIHLIALHSIVVGVFLLILPPWAVRFGGFGEVSPPFFAHQAGAFHLVVAAAYLIEYLRYRGVIILVFAKALATVFLFACTLLDGAPWIVPFSGVADFMMGAVVLVVHLKVARERQ
ncbi:MAG: hypothetical protein AB1714_11555 [Acidobacteriota bacterium]